MTDAEILDRLRNGDEETTRVYFYGWCRMAYSVCDERYGLWSKEGMDFYSLSHDFYLRLALDGWRSPQRRSSDMKLSTWMVNGFRYVVLDRLKTNARREADIALSQVNVTDDGLSREVRMLLSDLIYGTYAGDATAQAILQSILVEGYSGKETAERLGITPSAVSQRFTSMMRDTVKPYFMEHFSLQRASIAEGYAEAEEDASILPDLMPMGGAASYRELPDEEIYRKARKQKSMFGKLFFRKKREEGTADGERQRNALAGLPRNRISPEVITRLAPDEIFVFGSNLAGMHGGGAARIAHKQFGAEWGVGVGLTGRTYAIPTMQGGAETIAPYVDQFIAFAREHADQRFLVTRIGCGIAGFDDSDIAPLFDAAKDVENIALPEKFWKYIVR